MPETRSGGRLHGRPRGRWAGTGLAVLSAGLLFAAGEPLGAGLLAWVALVPLFVAVRWSATRPTGAGRWAFAYGFVFGLAYFAVHISWIFLFGWMAWVALVVVLSLYVGLGTLVAGRLAEGRYAPLLMAGAWVGAELLRDRWPFGGYSWGSVGTTQTTVPGVRWLAGTIGVYGLSFLIAFVAGLIARAIVDGQLARTPIVVVAVGLLAFVVPDLALGASGESGRRLRVGVVQGNVPRPVVAGQRDAILRNHLDLTRELLGSPSRVDVVVWPEEAVGEGASPGALARVQALARQERVSMLIGQTVVSEDRFLNLVRHVDEQGHVIETYQKRHPVPFGEYVPLGFLRRFVGTLESEIPTDQVPGTRANAFDVSGTKIATPICFESVFPRDFLDFVRNGAELFVLSTNDTSFERSYASQQHLAHTRMRALETRQWVIQAALSGISATIRPDGHVLHQTRLFEADAFVADVRVRPAPSLYVRIGDVFPMLFAVAAAIAFVLTFRRRRSPPPDRQRTEILAA